MTARYSVRIQVEAAAEVARLIAEVLAPDEFLPRPTVGEAQVTFTASSDSPRRLRAELNSLLRSLALIEELLTLAGDGRS